MRGEPLPVAGAFDDDLVAGVGESVEGAVAEDGIVEEAEPFLDGPVGGDDEAGDAVSADDQLVEVGGLLGGEPVEAAGHLVQYATDCSHRDANGWRLAAPAPKAMAGCLIERRVQALGGAPCLCVQLRLPPGQLTARDSPRFNP